MANLQDVPIELGGRSLTLRFSIKATLALKEKWGLEHEREVQAKMARASMAEFIDIVWAGLRTHHPEVTHEQVVDLLDDAGADGMQSAVERALSAAAAPPSPSDGQAT